MPVKDFHGHQMSWIHILIIIKRLKQCTSAPGTATPKYSGLVLQGGIIQSTV